MTGLKSQPTLHFDDLIPESVVAHTGLAHFPVSGFFEGSPIATFVIDTNHIVTHFNMACVMTLGVNAVDVIGRKSLGRVFYGYDRPVMADLIVDGSFDDDIELLYHGKYSRSSLIPGAFEAEDFFPAFGEHGRWLAFTAAPLRDLDGRIIGAIETLRDISDLKKVQEDLLKAQVALSEKLAIARDQLVQSEKLSSIGQLAAGVAHEINNPIGYIFSNFSILEKYILSLFQMLEAYEDAESSHGDARTVNGLKTLRQQIEIAFLKVDIPLLMSESREGIIRVRKIVKDLKDFSHVDANPEWQLADLEQCIESTLNVVANEIKYKAEVVKDYAILPVIQCRAPELNQVIMNLIVNAADAIGPELGKITIRTGTDYVNVWFEVEDTGSGIADESLPRIFDPFYTTKPIGKGTGLGLSLSYGIVQKHRGRIEVQTEIGTGTNFRVTLPIEQLATEFTVPAPLI